MVLDIPNIEIGLTEYRKNIIAIFSLFILISVIYSNSLNGSWHFDDKQNILDRKAIHLSEWTWPNIKKIFHNDETGYLYRPVACLSFAINYYFGKDNTLGYHLVNISIHLLTSIVLYLFIYHILNLPMFKANYQHYSYSIALLSALLWSVNPIQTQAVTYIVQRMASLCGMFYILSMYCYLRSNTALKSAKKILFFICFIFSGILAIGAKENALMLPLSIFLINYFFFQNSFKFIQKKHFVFWIAISGVLLSMGLLFVTYSDTIHELLKGYELRPFTLQERILSEPRILLFYLSLIVYPMPGRLSIQHDFILSKSLFTPPTTLVAILVIIGIVTLAFYYSKKHPFLSFSLLFFFCNHIVESSILPLELIFEHRNYIPSMFLFVPVSIFLIYGISKSSLKSQIKYLIAFATACLIFIFCNGTFMRNAVWQTDISLWTDATHTAPHSWRSWHNLAEAYEKIDTNQALINYLKAIPNEICSYRDDRKLTYYNMGRLHQGWKNYDKALAYYLEAEKIDPNYPPLLNNMGVVYLQTGLIDQSIQKLTRTIQLDPKLYQPHFNLGNIFLRQKNNVDIAMGFLEKSLILEPKNIAAIQLLGVAYRKKDLFEQAVIQHQMVLKLEPNNLSSLLCLAEIYRIQTKHAQQDATMNQFLHVLSEPDLDKLLDNIVMPYQKNTALIERETAALLIYDALTKNASSMLKKAKQLKKRMNTPGSPN